MSGLLSLAQRAARTEQDHGFSEYRGGEGAQLTGGRNSENALLDGSPDSLRVAVAPPREL